MKNIVCIIQARMSSTRLPGKVMLPLSGHPVIAHVFNQLSFSKQISKCVLATSLDITDDTLEKWAVESGRLCFRGSLNNVLERFYFAAQEYEADVVARVTADCPLIDPDVVDKVIAGFLDGKFDYYSNINPPTFPDGLDIEVFSFSALRKAFQEAKLDSEIEHVTPYLRNHPELFRVGNCESNKNYQDLRWTLDNKEDYELLKKVFEDLHSNGGYIHWQDVITYLHNHPSVKRINEHIERNEGYKKSLREDNI